MRPLLFLLLAAAVHAQDMGMPDVSELKRRSKDQSGGAVPAAKVETKVLSGSADLTPFIRRLEDLGMTTKTVRELLGKISVEYRAPRGAANAEWGYIRNVLYLPDTFKEKNSNAIRYDLAPNEVSTVIHEMTHAAREMIASETAAAGTPAREHYEAVKTIWADVRSEALLVRYSWWKADEVSGYYMGDAISEVVTSAGEIEIYNTALSGSKARDAGDTLLLPRPQDARNPWEVNLSERTKKPFSRVSVKETATFQGDLVNWEERTMTLDQMYNHILGLNPPKNPEELLARLNASDSAWIRGVKQKTAAKRAAAK
jgi:hypothetical protein